MATNAVYQKPGTAIVFTETGGSATFTPRNVANGAGRVSTKYDRGSGALPMRFKMEATFKAQAACTIGLPARIYAYSFQNGAAAADYVADAAVSAETQFANFQLIGSVYASSSAVGPFFGSWDVVLLGQYIVVGMWNASGQALTNVNGDNKITLTPIFEDIQAAT